MILSIKLKYPEADKLHLNVPRSRNSFAEITNCHNRIGMGDGGGGGQGIEAPRWFSSQLKVWTPLGPGNILNLPTPKMDM